MPEDTERLHNRDIRPRVSSSQHFNSAYDSLEPPGADACDAARTAPINSAVVCSPPTPSSSCRACAAAAAWLVVED